ncbi:MAG: hypothetical protein VX583_05885, partial [Bdellovibrionota bacterium]
GLLNPIHGIQNSEKIHFSEGLFLTSLFLNLVAIFLFAGAGGLGGFAADGFLSCFALKSVFVFFGWFCLGFLV